METLKWQLVWALAATTLIFKASVASSHSELLPTESVVACNTPIDQTYRIVAVGGLFPVPSYLAIDPLPGGHSQSLYFTLIKDREAKKDEMSPVIAFGNGYFGRDLPVLPKGLAYKSATDMQSCSGGLTIQYFELEGARIVNGVSVNSAAVLRGPNSRIDLYGSDVRCVVEQLLEAFTQGNSNCGVSKN